MIDLSTLARKTPEGRVDHAEVTRLAMAISLNRVYIGREAKPAPLMGSHDYCDEPYSENVTGRCLAYRLASCLACRRPIFVDSPRRPCGARSYHHCPKEVAA